MNKMKGFYYGTGTLLSLIGLGAIVSGIGFILQPDGESMGVTVNFLQDSPFTDFLIPGIFLFTVNGILCLIGAFLAFTQHRLAGIVTILLGASMVVWIASQVEWIGWGSWLQPTFLVVGLVEMFIGVYMDGLHPDNQEMLGRHRGTHSH